MTSIVIRALKANDAAAIATARAAMLVDHTIIYEGKVDGSTIDTSIFGGGAVFCPDAYLLIGKKV
ncbi:hypothetical protein [Undibacterium sp. Ji22W]|uniref:hypothetical protein n=1 Tax=Undibacterium sp. Ji22W TaxID=3413038 RepID=UPI003BF0CA34